MAIKTLIIYEITCDGQDDCPSLLTTKISPCPAEELFKLRALAYAQGWTSEGGGSGCPDWYCPKCSNKE